MSSQLAPPQAHTKFEFFSPAESHIHHLVGAFAAALSENTFPNIAAYLPAEDHPFYLPILCELIRLDILWRWENDVPKDRIEYQLDFPAAFAQPQFTEMLDRELSSTYSPHPDSDASDEMIHYPRTISTNIPSEALLAERRTLQPGRKSYRQEDVPDLAKGMVLLNFEVEETLGVGAFAKVFLARESDLKNRRVVLKLTRASQSEIDEEAEVLAQLVHTNIVPIYSHHTWQGLHVTCMPYLGRLTLADVLDRFRQFGFPSSGKNLSDTLLGQQSTQTPSDKAGHRQKKQSGKSGSVKQRHVENLFAAEHRPATDLPTEQTDAMSYCEEVLRFCTGLASGLDHAHQQDILHRDIKPANILITEEGRPMLLDFNLAEDRKLHAEDGNAHHGGTPIYMSPEQLQAFGGLLSKVDSRSDTYSLGIILYELLTGRFPFPTYSGKTESWLKRMVADRKNGPAPMKVKAPGVTPAVEAIARKCLHPNPDKRYQRARDLQEDIERHLQHRPLKHAHERSLWEVISKWKRRHPRLTSATSTSLIALVMIFFLAMYGYSHSESAKKLRAESQYQSFSNELVALQCSLFDQVLDDKKVQDLTNRTDELLEHYNFTKDGDWQKQDRVRYLSAKQKQALHHDICLLLLLKARATVFEGVRNKGQDYRKGVLDALDWNHLAERYGAESEVPCAMWSQRADFYRVLNDREKYMECRKHFEEAKQKPKSEADLCLCAREYVIQGLHRAAIPLLKEVIMKNRKNVSAYTLQGRCQQNLGQFGKAAQSYSAAIALKPEASSQPFFQRGLARLNQKDYDGANEDFTEVLARDPLNSNALINRALALHGKKKTKEAIADLTAAMELQAPVTRVLFIRSRYYAEIGEEEAAKKDREEGLRTTPRDDVSWVARGVEKLKTDPEGALADFSEALRLNRKSLSALANSAYVLAKDPKTAGQAIDMYDQLLSHHPHHYTSWAARGLLHAKAGNRDKAIRDAKETLRRTASPHIVYRVASIYAQTAKEHPEDRKQAISLLKRALKRGYGHRYLESDPNLEPIRNTVHFQQLKLAARVLG